MTFALREYQKEAVLETMTDLKSHKNLGLILPTGAGKTEIFIHIVDMFLNSNPESSVLVLSHLSILTRQTMERAKLRTPHISTGILQGTNKPKYDNRLIISTMQTSKSEKHTSAFIQDSMYKVGLIIVDEAHYIYCDSYQKTLDQYPGIPVIGCTATPFRDSQIMTDYFDKISYSISLQNLIDNKYLVPPKLKQIVKTSDSLEQVIANVVNLYREEQAGKKAIIFMKTIADAKLLRNIFTHHGISSAAITSNLTGDDRENILNEFKHGEINVLTTVNVLSAGFDAPNVSAIFMPYATKSPTLYLQRTGRGLRTCPDINKKHCDVYVFGSAPSISKSLYVKMNNLVLNKGGKIREYDSFTETLDYNDWDTSSDQYEWNKTVVDTINHMDKIGMPNLSQLLENKKFPKKFLKDIKLLLKSLPAKKSKVSHPNSPITVKQKDLLSRHGFTESNLNPLTKGEASSMISAVLRNSNYQNPYILKEGIHKGSHVSETPFSYRTTVKKKFPNSPVSKLITQWENQRK